MALADTDNFVSPRERNCDRHNDSANQKRQRSIHSLNPVSEEDAEWAQPLIDAICDKVGEGDGSGMTMYHGPRSKKPPPEQG